jgi:hypothetical protein
MALSTYRAFALSDCDYYELQEDLGEVLSKGAIFVLDETYSKIPREITLIPISRLVLCWKEDGSAYGGASGHTIPGGGIALHSDFAFSSLFKMARAKESDKRSEELYPILLTVEEMRESLERIGEQIKEMMK